MGVLGVYLEPKIGHGLKEGGQDTQEIDGPHRDAVSFAVQQPCDDGEVEEASHRHDVGKRGDSMLSIALVLQLQPRGSQVKLHAMVFQPRN